MSGYTEEARVEAAARGVATAARWMAAAGHAAAVAPGRLSKMSSDEQDSLATLLEDLVEATSQEKVEGPPRSAAAWPSARERRMAFNLARVGRFLLPDALALVSSTIPQASSDS